MSYIVHIMILLDSAAILFMYTTGVERFVNVTLAIRCSIESVTFSITQHCTMVLLHHYVVFLELTTITAISRLVEHAQN